MTANKYTKTQLVEADLEELNSDVLQVVLEDDKTYTTQEARKLVDKFCKEKEVK